MLTIRLMLSSLARMHRARMGEPPTPALFRPSQDGSARAGAAQRILRQDANKRKPLDDWKKNLQSCAYERARKGIEFLKVKALSRKLRHHSPGEPGAVRRQA